MRVLVALVVGWASVGAIAAAGPSEPRWILRVDVGLWALPNVGMEGGGGILLPYPFSGTTAGLSDGGGAEIGVEARVSRWLALDVGFASYRPPLEVYRFPVGSGPRDDRSASVELRWAEVGLVIAPPKLRIDRGRLAFGILAVRSDLSSVPPSLGIAIEGGHTELGADARGEIFLSKNRHWGMGMALVYPGVDLPFVDLETGARGKLQMSNIVLRLGLRGAW